MTPDDPDVSIQTTPPSCYCESCRLNAVNDGWSVMFNNSGEAVGYTRSDRPMTANADMVNNPPHYTSGARCECGKTIECIQVIEDLTLNVGNAIKYLWRQGKKGDAIEDLKKAAWYVNREIKRLETFKGKQ